MASRLSRLDASFLSLERDATPLHSGGVGIFEPGLAYTDVLRVVEDRLADVPLGRKRISLAGLGTGRPVWTDDQAFDITYHVRHAALPAPGDTQQLGEYVSRIIGRPLDRSRPLWELYVIEGLEGGRVCIFRKVHLAMSGNGQDPFSVVLDERAFAAPAPPAGARRTRWDPEPPPSTVALAFEAALERAAEAAALGRGLGEVVAAPRRLARAAESAAGSALGLAGRILPTAPRSPLNRRLSPHRRFAIFSVPLEDLRRVRRALGAAINDVIVAVSGDALGRMLRWRGDDTKDLDLRVMVPVRVQGDDGGLGAPTAGGRGVVGVLAPLPVMEMDPVARLYRIMGEMAGLKESRQAVAAGNLVRLAGFAPPALHAMAARVATGQERHNVALSNAPGPQEPRWLAGSQLLENYSFIPLTGDSALSIAATSYVGQVSFGLLGDREAVPDLDLLADFLDEALGELVAAAEGMVG